jgi:heat shock protein HtpX
VRNLDIRFSLIVGVLVGSIALLSDFFLRFTFWGGGRGRSRDREGGGGGFAVVMMVVALALAILAPIAARFVQLAVSRQREYLADATGAALLRDAEPLAQALETLERGREAIPMQVNPATASMYIVNPLHGGGMAALFSTHPPMGERIRRLRGLRLTRAALARA